MAIESDQISLTTSPVAVAEAPLGSLLNVRLRNRSASAAVFVGAADVSSSSGFQLDAGDELVATLWPGELVYAMTSSSGDIHTLTGGL